jgi:hypothetical protein
VASVPNSQLREERVDAVILHYLQEIDAGRRPDPAHILAQHPDLADELQAFFADEAHVDGLTTPLKQLSSAPTGQAETADVVQPVRTAAGTPPVEIGGYRPLRLLGAGGMGRVYEAEDALGRRVALKLISPGFAASAMALERFRREGRLAGMISHPRCVFVVAADEERGQPYIVMELMTGSTLKDLVDRQGPLAPRDAILKILDVMEGLQEAHETGVLHRDVKPSNCYLGADGRVKIGDFGLSRSLGARAQLTRVGSFVGTPLFASPEQLKGEELDARTDVYSVAATLYYLLTGQAPFQHADAATVIARVVTEPPLSPRQLRPDLPTALERVVLRGLERQRERRFQNLEQLREVLLPLLPTGLSIAGLGLRVGAFLFDSLPFWIAGEVHAIWSFQRQASLDLGAHFALVTSYFVYFWLSEGLWGQTVGKWLAGLRVTRASGAEPCGLARTFGRTAVLFLLYGLAVDIILWLAFDPLERPTWALFHGLGELVGLLVCFCPARARTGYRGLHELLSGTRTVLLPRRPASRIVLDTSVTAMNDQLRTAEGRVGPFKLTGIVHSANGADLLTGEDTGLGRHVWIWRRPLSEPDTSALRRELSRSTRLRWLSAGEADGRRWDAFVAPAGGRLSQVIARRGACDWPVTHGLLVQLAEELSAAVADGTLPAGLTADQLWIHANGRLQLTDWPSADDASESATPDERALRFWRQAAGLLLEGDVPTGGPVGPIRAPLPLHARMILDRFSQTREPYQHIAQVRDDLAATRDRPTHVTLGLRALQMALASCFLAIGLVHLFVWGRMAALAEPLALDRALVRAEALVEVLKKEQLVASLRADLPAGHVLQGDPAPVIAALQAQIAADRQAHAVAVRELGPIGAMATTAIRQQTLGSDERPRVNRDSGQAFGVVVFSNGAFGNLGRLTLSDIERILARAHGEEDPEIRRFRDSICYTGVFMVGFWPAVWVLWDFLFRGGISLRVAGLALVRDDGRPARRLQCAWRVCMLWAPAVTVLLVVVWLDVEQRGNLLLCTSLQGLAAFMLVVQAMLTLRFPGRAPHDWLAAVHVVPR